MSDDADDLSALTPAHFLIGEPLRLPLPERYEIPPKMSLELYKNTQLRVQAFWKRWTAEFLPTLLSRPKWKEEQTNLKPGQLVILMDDLLAPTYWPLGRIVRVKTSEDGKVRTATVRIGKQNDSENWQEYDRPVQKLCVLPIDDELDNWR